MRSLSFGLPGVSLAACMTIPSPVHAEMCGIDTIFLDGFQNQGGPALAAYPGVQQSPGLVQSIDGGTLALTITYPSSGVTISADSTQVVGTYSGPLDVGITVNGVLATTSNGQFVASAVALDPGSNSLQVTAKKLTDETATTSISVTQATGAAGASLAVDRTTGFAPFDVTFRPTIVGLAGGVSMQSIAIDYEGDGTDDVTTTNVQLGFSHRYNSPGVFPARLTVTDSQSQQYVFRRWIVIQDIAKQRGMLCDIYSYMRDRMHNQDVAGAVKALQPRLRPYYQNLFTTLGSNLPTVETTLGVIISGVVSTEFAELLVVRESGGIREGFPMQFTLGSDGVWRISGI